MAKFRNREQAGQQLAAQLAKYASESPVLMGIPNGGVPVGMAVAQSSSSALTVVPIRSLHIPWAEATIFGYVTNMGELHLNQPLIGQTRLSRQEIHQIARKRRLALQADLESWGIDVPHSLENRLVVIIDDGMHSGWTMFSAIQTVKQLAARTVVAAVPVTHFRARRFVARHCDAVVSLLTDGIALYQIDNYYEEFPEISNDLVGSILNCPPNSPRQSAA
jgi:predicted phosphoribosyltransferase